MRALLLCTLACPAEAQFIQRGNKLTGNGAVGSAYQATAVAVSSSGGTVIIGGWDDNNGVGAAWFFTQSSGVWTQQGAKVVGSNAVGQSLIGWSVAISSDGNTAIVGGPNDDGYKGAAWVFTRSGGIWSQQGSKLMGDDTEGAWIFQGASVGLSSDGNTAIIGGYNDNNSAGAAWIYTRSNGAWSQQGSKLVGSGADGAAYQGWSVALSGDASTAIIGGIADNNSVGASWVFTQSGGIWSEQKKLVGSGAVGQANQGTSVALSSNGGEAIIGGPNDNSYAGAAWVFTQSVGVWSQQGSKLVGSGAAGSALQGAAVALSGDTAISGGWGDNNDVGAAWVFTQSNGTWSQQGNKLVGAGAAGSSFQGNALALSPDETTAVIGGWGDNNDAGAAWIFTPGCQVSVPLLMQTTAPWASQTYDHTQKTIAQKGCALTSLTMALDYGGQSWDPGTLNALLNGLNLWGSGGAVDWGPSVAVADVGYAGDALSFDTLGGWVDSDTNMSRALDQVSQAVCGTPGLPVIVGVRSPSTGHYVGHFVLVTGQISNPDGSVAFTINDPYDPITLIGIDQQTGNSGYLNPSTNLPEFTTKGTVHDPAVLTGLSVIVDDVVNLMVTDPNGFQSGYSLGNSIPLQNIPNSGAGVDEIDDEVTGQAGSPVQTVLVNGAAAGTFQVSVTGTTAAPYTLQIVSEASDGSIQTFSSPGTAAIGVTTIYGVSFTGTPGGAGIATINGSPVSACDVGYQGTTSVSDVQISINQALGAASPANDLNGDGVVNVVDVQIVIKAALGLRCTAR